MHMPLKVSYYEISKQNLAFLFVVYWFFLQICNNGSLVDILHFRGKELLKDDLHMKFMVTKSIL